MTKQIASISPRVSLKRYIHVVRGQSVMLDSDLAALYEVTTGNLNLAVRRNKTRFPEDFMLTLTKAEAEGLLLQNARANAGRGGRRTQPYVFTELGVAMLSSVLNSERAVQMNMEIMRAFVRLRRIAAQRRNLGVRVEKLEQSHHRAASVIEVLAEDIDRIERNLDRLKRLPAPRKRKIGFGA